MNVIDMNRKCRICLKTNKNMKPMSSLRNPSTTVSVNYNQMLDEILNNRLVPPTNPPNNLCAKCERNLIAAYAFIKLCRHTEDVLLQGKLSMVDGDVPSDDSNSLMCDENDTVDHYDKHMQEIMWNPQTIVDKSADFVIIDEERSRDMYDEDTANEPADNNNAVDANETDTTHIAYKYNPAGYVEDGVYELATTIETKSKHCRGCQLVFATVKEYQVHYRSVHQRQILCPLCGKMVAKFTLDKHMTSHTKTKDHLCNACGKRFTLADNLKKHWRIHTGEKRYSCEYCDEKFIHWNSKRSHVRTVYTGEKKLVHTAKSGHSRVNSGCNLDFDYFVVFPQIRMYHLQ